MGKPKPLREVTHQERITHQAAYAQFLAASASGLAASETSEACYKTNADYARSAALRADALLAVYLEGINQ